MAGKGLEPVTVLFPDVEPRVSDKSATVVDEKRRIARFPVPSSAVQCAIPITLRMLSGHPRAIVRVLDVSGAIATVEHALPTTAPVWIQLPLPGGIEVVSARVVRCERLQVGEPWQVELKFIIRDPSTRSGLAGLVRALRARRERRGAR